MPTRVGLTGELPRTLGNLSRLRVLRSKAMPERKDPAGMGRLSGLKTLDLSGKT